MLVAMSMTRKIDLQLNLRINARQYLSLMLKVENIPQTTG
jgi:hypothetical protein